MRDIKLRREMPSDYKSSEEVTREAFWNHHVPGCDEHYLLHVMRDADSFIQELDFVAEQEEKIVGSIAYMKAKIMGDDGNDYEVITFGPISVLPAFQGKGIGGLLIRHTCELAKKMGFRAILIYGDPDYYSRFGFVEAKTYNIRTADDMYAVPLQALELLEGALEDCSGRFMEGSTYEIDQVKSQEFDKDFIYKEKRDDLPSQQRFLQLVAMRTPRE